MTEYVHTLARRELAGGLVILRQRMTYPGIIPWTAYSAFYRNGNVLDRGVGDSVRAAVAKLQERVAWKVAA